MSPNLFFLLNVMTWNFCLPFVLGIVVKESVSITFNKLHADPAMGKTLDIVLKKAKHRLVEKMSAATADALGLSRAILCNDALVRKLDELKAIENEYRGMVDHAKRVLKAYFDLIQVYKSKHLFYFIFIFLLLRSLLSYFSFTYQYHLIFLLSVRFRLYIC